MRILISAIKLISDRVQCISRLVPASVPPSIAARPERSGVIPDVPKQLSSNQQVLSTPLNAQARAWNNNKVNVPTHQANASTNHAHVPSGHVNDVPISQLHPTSENRHTGTELEQLQPHMTGNVINPPAYQQTPNMQIARDVAKA